MQDPLTWHQARCKIRHSLEEFLICSNDVSVAKRRRGRWHWARSNLDIIAGAIPLSIAILVLSSLSLHRHINNGSGEIDLPERPVYQGQVVAAAFMVLAALLSVVVLWRRRVVAKMDISSYQRREIKKYLSRSQRSEGLENNSMRSSIEIPREEQEMDKLVSGTSLTDFYPVYRRSDHQGPTGAWHSLPALLLVQGDFVALQVGDTRSTSSSTVGTSSASHSILAASADVNCC